MSAIGIDIGGTKIAGGLVSADGEVLTTARRDSPATDVKAIADATADLVAELRDAAGADAVGSVGIAAAGFVDRSRSVLVFAPNLAWRDVPMRQQMEDRLGLPVVIENDANAAAWGEFRFGAGEDVEDLLLLTVGTGVGGGIVQDGRLVRGGSGFGAEVGHLRVVPRGRQCGCGNLGCLEQYASGSALVAGARSLVSAGHEGSEELLAEVHGLDAIDGPLVTRAARNDNPAALAAFAELGRWLGEGAASLAAVLDPTVVVIGGGVVEAGDLLLEPTRRALAANLTAGSHRPPIEIRAAQLGNRAGVIGVADLATDHVD